MLPDFVSLMILIRAVDSRSLSKAAEQSHIALAAASRRIAILESRYGVPLLYRSARGIEPTPAGIALCRHSREMLLLAGKIDAELADFAKGVKGHIRIEANTSAITQTLPADLAAFAAHYPDVKLELGENRSVDIAQALCEGRIDIGIVMEGTPLDGLASYDYSTDRLVALVPRGHPIRAKAVAFERIIKFDLVGLDSSAAMTRLLADVALQIGEPLRLRMQVRSFESVCKLVQAGMGIGILPEDAATNYTEPMGLRLIRLTDAWAVRRMVVCVRDLESLPVVARKLVAQLVSRPSQNAKA